MNRKMWFYGASMVLLVLTATYLMITIDSNSWEYLKGRQGASACHWVTIAPVNAPMPGNCTIWNGCDDIVTHGTHGYCQTTDTYTGWDRSHDQWSHGHIIKQTRDCRLSLFRCNNNGVTPTPGSLTECILSPC